MSNILKKLNEMAQVQSQQQQQKSHQNPQNSQDSKNLSNASLPDQADPFQNGDHPGKLLQQELNRVQITPEAVAKFIKVDPKVIKSILTQTPASQPINAPLSLRLACFCGVADTFWLRLQGLYDCARHRDGIRKLNIPNWTQVCPEIPARDLPHSQRPGQTPWPQIQPLDPGLKSLIEENIQTAQVVTQGIP